MISKKRTENSIRGLIVTRRSSRSQRKNGTDTSIKRKKEGYDDKESDSKQEYNSEYEEQEEEIWLILDKRYKMETEEVKEEKEAVKTSPVGGEGGGWTPINILWVKSRFFVDPSITWFVEQHVYTRSVK